MTETALAALSDEELAARLAEPGAEQALVTEAYRRFFPVMLRAAALVLKGDVALAEDVVHECFARIVLGRRLERLGAPDSLRAYLVASVRNAAIDLARTRRHHEPLTPETEDLGLAGEPLDPLREHPRLQAVLDRLSLTEREMVKLRFEQGLKLEEIARRLGITYAAAAQRLSRAIHHARELG